MELNPNHRVTSGLHDHWHKLLAAVLHKYQHALPADVVITGADVDALARLDNPAVVAHNKADGLHLRIVEGPESERLAREAGGLPS